MTYEDVITLLGEFGFYQKRVYFLLCLPAISGCMQALMSVFTLAVPDHRCAIPGLDNDTWDLQDSKHTAMFNASIPTSDTLSSMCRLYADVTPRLRTSNWSYPMVRNGNFSYADNEGQGLRETTSCSRYVYDTSSYTSTIVTQMDLVCENQLLRSHAQMVFMSGALFGSVACGLPSDIFGRKKMLMISLVLHSVASLVITWSSYFPFLCVLLFLNGAAVTGIFTNAFVIGMELVGPSKRVWTGYVMEIFWSLGMMLLAPIAFFVRDWQRLQLTTSLLTLPFLSYWWLVPESPRWLMSRGRRQEAEAILQTVAKTNKVCLPEKLLDGAECLREEERQVEEESVLAALQHPAILTRCFVIFYAWMVSSLTFYGLNLNVGSLSGNVYVNFLLSGIMELVSYILCLCLLDRVGRRALNCGLMILAGVTCTATIFPVLYAPPSWQWLTVALAMVGKLGIAGAFATIWVYTSELLPTVIRNSGVGASSFCARIGAIISPYIANLDQTIGGNAGKAVPLVIFGVSSMIAGLLLLFLPETLNRRLPETVQDVIDMGSRSERCQSRSSIYTKASQKARDSMTV